MENDALERRSPISVALVGLDWHLLREWAGPFAQVSCDDA